MEDKVCVIVPARKNSSCLEKCVASLAQLDYQNYEIIVVDDSKEGFTNGAEFSSQLKVLNSYGRGPSYARNLAAKATTAEFLAFTDSDCIVDRNWLKKLREGFLKYPEAASCGGRQDIPPDASVFEKRVFLFMKKAGIISDYVRSKDAGIVNVKHNPSCNVMYRREIFIKEGGFLEGFWPGEDVELDYRLAKKGYKLVFNPQAVVYHYKPKDMRSFLRMMYRYGAAQGFLARKYGIFRKVQLIPALALIYFFLFLAFAFYNLHLALISTFTVLALFFLYLNLSFSQLFLAILAFFFWHIGFFVLFFRPTVEYK